MKPLKRNTPKQRKTVIENSHKPKSHQYMTFTIALVAHALNIEQKKILVPKRSQKNITLARQITSYLMHVACQINISKTARLLKKDRATITHACHKIENQRDNPIFNYMIDHLEAVIKLWIKKTAQKYET